MYPKTTDLVTQERRLNFGLRFYSTLRAKQRHPVVECRIWCTRNGRRIPFTLRHYWEVLKGSLKWIDTKVPSFAAKHQARKRYKTSGSSSFNTESGDTSINMNVDVGDDEEDEHLARLMVSELAMHNKRAIEMKNEERLAFLEIKRRDVECHERELTMQEYRQRQEDIRFYMHPYNHLTKDALNHMEALRAEIKAK
ncbi:hypothetical protein Tco_1468703 [Tanacetum coccineum]